MTSRNTSPRYHGLSIALHWLLAFGLVGSFAVGIYMHELPFSPTRLKLYNWHKWAGVVILALSVLRLLWRLTHRPPADVPMPAWQLRAMASDPDCKGRSVGRRLLEEATADVTAPVRNGFQSSVPF